MVKIYSYSNFVPIIEELEKLNLTPVSFSPFDPASKSIPSTLSGMKRQVKPKVTEELVGMNHDHFNDFKTKPSEHLLIS